MHACPICQEPCTCDAGQPGSDVWTEPPADCQHECDEADAVAYLQRLFADE